MMRGWKESELGLIPSDWIQAKLSEYAEKPQYGFTDSSSNTGNVKFLRITDITDMGVNWQDVPYCNCPDIEKYKLVDGDIVFARIGATTGKSYIINKPPKAVFASYLIRVRTRELLLPEYLIRFFNSEFYWKQINSQKGNNLKGGVNGSILSELQIIVPPLLEQRKIAYVLKTIQKAIEQQDKLIRTTSELKKALMQKLFTEGTKGEKQKQTEIGLVPESWEVVELMDICERISTNVQPNSNGEKPYVGLEHIVPGQTHLTTWGKENEVVSSKAEFKEGEILYGKLRPYLDKAVIAHFDGISSTDILIFSGKKNIQNEFLVHFFHTEKFIEFAKSTTSGVQHPRTSWSSLKKLKLGLPSKPERTNIAMTLNLFENKLLYHQKKKLTLADLYKTLLNDLITGQRRVNEIDFHEQTLEYTLPESTLSIAAEN